MNKYLIVLLTAAAVCGATAQPREFTVDVSKPGAEIRPTMYGLFFEDINFAADGGLYGELVKNRSFEFPQRLMGWRTFGKVTLKEDGPFENNPHYVRLGDSGHRHRHTGIENEGFFGIGVRAGEQYRFSVWARLPEGSGTGKVRVQLVDNSSQGERQDFVTQEIEIASADWRQYEAILTPEITNPKAALRITLAGAATVDLEHVSLFPADTWNGHRNGLRRDLAQALADLSPGVFRFPGGCIVEGTELENRYDWKKSVGPVENRPLNENRWHFTFAHRLYPDYYQSYGLGFYEYFVLSEELGAEPLPVLNCGMACQYQCSGVHDHADECDLEEFIQDALDLVEFANGPATSTWGSVRAGMGHPEPFGLKFIAIGNEQWGEEYVVRLEPFIERIRAVYPDIAIIGGSGPGSEGAEFDYLWPEMARLKVDLVDEHFYRPEQWFLSQGARYDGYDRKGPKVFAGEYACHGRGKKWNHFNAALLEAAFLTGVERNADIVHMATYAPLFAHYEGWQWRPDLIWFDNLEVVRTASYYVQQLYALNKGTHVIPVTLDGRPATGAEGQDGLFASAVLDADSGEYVVKVANTSDQAREITLVFKGLKKKTLASEGTVTTLSSEDPDLENTVARPDAIVPVVTAVTTDGSSLRATVAANSFAVYRVGVE
ncbi:MAG: carbohydrate binding domain-containing protein [Alistipes sp.]|nr:carbohydrate binding domain-containing protein [Alistipes sp.]